MNEQMTNIKAKINEALRVISCIAVSGDAVDYMCIARKQLKDALKECEQNGG